MRISMILTALLHTACANTSVVIPIRGPVGIHIEADKKDCDPVIVNGKEH